jgi:glycosyltransferase involved in cell wall biosynthesis
VQLAHFHFGGSYGWGNRRAGQCPTRHTSQLGIPCISTNHGAFSLFDGYCGPQRSALTKLALLPPAWLAKLQQLASVRCEVTVSQHDFHAVRRWYFPKRAKFRQIYHSRIHEPVPVVSSQREPRIVCVGTIGRRKGQPFLVEAFGRVAARHPGWTLELIGRCADDAMGRQIEAMVNSPALRGRVQIRSGIPDAEVTQALARAEIFAMPSLAEGLGLSLQEALFHGCACIASRAGGMQDLVQHEENGLLAGAGNVTELAAALDRLMSDARLRERFRTRGPKSVLEKDMTAERMVGRYEALYRACLNDELPA